MFDINNTEDVVSIASCILGMPCSLYEIEKDAFLMKTVYGEVHAIRRSDIEKIITRDRANRLPEKTDRVLILASDRDYQNIPLKYLKELHASGMNLTIYSPSKILAPVPAHYITDTNTAWRRDSDRVVTQRFDHSATIGDTMIEGIPVLAVNLDHKLVENRDEAYVESLRGCDVYVADEFGQFLLSMEGIEAKIL